MLNNQKLVISIIIPHFELVMQTIKNNIFRPLSCYKGNNISLELSDTGVECEELVSDPNWPNIRGIYEIFNSIINNNDLEVKTLKNYITPNFISEVR